MARAGGNPLIYQKPKYEVAMAEKPIGVRLPIELDEFVRNLPNRAEWLREAIAEKRQREMLDEDCTPHRYDTWDTSSNENKTLSTL